jgi:hypothetical protein
MFTLALTFFAQAEEGVTFTPKRSSFSEYWIDLYEFLNQKGELPSCGLNLSQTRMLGSGNSLF